MNAVEIEQAVSALSERPFDRAEFPFAFLEAFDRKATTLKKLRSGESNKSDVGGMLQTGHIHIAVAPEGEVGTTLAALKASPATAKAKARFVLATDGVTLEAEDLRSDAAPVVCPYADLPDRFGFFLPLAGITTVARVSENAFDIRATARLNKLYLELRQLNPEWDGPERRSEMNHFLARLIFCFFAQSTDIFLGDRLFSDTVEQMGARDGSDTHVVIETIFRAMSLKDRAGLPRWADAFPFVNGGLFSGSTDVPRFSGIARAHLRHIGSLDWRKINPDIFGSMIQAVADDAERGALGMHYTSVPNILKVLNPLFLDDLRAKLAEAGDNGRTLLNLRRRMARIRVFDPACGSGNFLVIAYKEMRDIEAVINERRGEPDRRSEIPLTNFRGIEIRDFPAEIARLALIIAEYQCDVALRGQKEALADFLPLDAENWIVCGNALRLDWLSICPPVGTGVKHIAEDLFGTPLDQAQIEFEHAGGETYVCGNPPYRGSQQQSQQQKDDVAFALYGICSDTRALDYVCGWFGKAVILVQRYNISAAYVATNSINQGRQVDILWESIFKLGIKIIFAEASLQWTNLASHNAGVTVSIIGFSSRSQPVKFLCTTVDGRKFVRSVDNINGYLIAADNIHVTAFRKPMFGLPEMSFGNMPNDGGLLQLSWDLEKIQSGKETIFKDFIRPHVGSFEFVNGVSKFCIWVNSEQYQKSLRSDFLATRFKQIRVLRASSNRKATRALADLPYRFGEVRQRGHEAAIIVPRITSARREYLPVGITEKGAIISSQNFALYDGPKWAAAILISQVHRCWIAAVCGRTRTDFAYSNTLGWNTFPVPLLTEQNKGDLNRCAEDILLAREAHFPATIADLYDPEAMPADLRAAHERNDEVLERIYIGRRFRNDTERLEKLFDMYAKMIAERQTPAKPPAGRATTRKAKAEGAS